MTIVFIIFGLIIGVLLYATLEYRFLVPQRKGLPILMYHKISVNEADNLTVRIETLEQHFKFLKQNNYQCLNFKELYDFKNKGIKPPKKSVVITFDDGYQNNYDYLLPLLEKYGFKATIFLPFAHLGTLNAWDRGHDKLMSIETVKEISKLSYIELGIHSYQHQNFKYLSLNEIDNDLKQCDLFIKENELKVAKVIAYPYGATKRKDPEQNEKMKLLLSKYGYWFGLRIGNRINSLKWKNPYELFRIDVKGTDRFFEFKIKIKKGRLKFF